MNNLYFCISSIILLISTVTCIVWSGVLKYKRLPGRALINPSNVFFASAFVAFMVIFIPTAYKINGNYFMALISSFMDTLKSLSFGSTLNDMNTRVFGGIQNLLTATEFWHRIYVGCLSILVPTLGLRVLYLIFKDFFTQTRYTLNVTRNIHIFSELNEKSLVTARSISRGDRRARIIFCSVMNNAASTHLNEQARTINAWLTKKSVVGFKIRSLSAKKVCIYFIGQDERNNLRFALDKEKALLNVKKEVDLLIFSSLVSAERVVDTANENNKNRNVRLDLFNEAQRTAYNIVYDHPLYDLPEKNTINVMVLGAGGYGLEFAKAASWCSQMMNRKFSIRLFDKQNKECNIGFPFSMLQTKLKKIGTDLNADFKVCDVFSDEFDSLRFEKADYVFIDIGDDESNVKAALLVHKLYSRKSAGETFAPSGKTIPKIVLIIRNQQTKTIVEALGNENIIPYGTLNDVFDRENIYSWKIDRIAQFIHACYFSYNRALFNPSASNDDREAIAAGMIDYRKQTEFNKRSSRATAVHCKYKFFDLGIDPTKETLCSSETTQCINDHIETLLRAEHDRWSAFQTLDGWDSWDKSALIKNVHKDKDAMLHAYLAEFDDLKSIAEFVYGDNVDPTEYDRVIIRAMRPAYLFGEYDITKEEAAELYLNPGKQGT